MTTELPRQINLGCGRRLMADAVNIDIDPNVGADAVLDLSQVEIGEQGSEIQTQRFGNVRLMPNGFDQIHAFDMLQQVRDLPRLMRNCLALLRPGGALHISVPYDLSFHAWGDPANVRGFNEGSFARYMSDNPAFDGARDHFELTALDYRFSHVANELQGKGLSVQEIARTPRAVDALTATLCKALAGQSVTVVGMPDQQHPLLQNWNRIKDKFCIWLVTPKNFIHTLAFYESAISLSSAFRALGGSAPLVRHQNDFKGRIPIIYGANVLPEEFMDKLPAETVLVNMEQVTEGSDWFRGAYSKFVKRFAVLETSTGNIERFRAIGVHNTALLPLAPMPEWTKIRHAQEKDIDVLFYGSMTERRRAIILALIERGLKVKTLFGVYGEERDMYIGRSKIVINIHVQPDWLLETVRVLYLLANRACVVTEGGLDDPEAQRLSEGLAVTDYDHLVEKCVELVGNAEERQRLAENGYRIVMQKTQADYLKELVAPF